MSPALLLFIVLDILFGVAVALLAYLCYTPRGLVTPATGLLLKAAARIEAKKPLSWDPVERRKLADADMHLISATPREKLLVEDLTIEGPAGALPLRSYRSEKVEASSILLFIHGGGWMVGSIEAYDPVAGNLCVETGARVLSLGYRLAPEAPFPAAVEDVLAAYAWIGAEKAAGRLPALPVFVAGDSAGGNLSAILCLAARDRGLPTPAGQILFYPVTDLSGTDTTSYQLFEKGFFLSRADMEWFIASYAPEADDRKNPLASPLLAQDLSRLPPALVITAGLDVLRDEGEAYAARLREAGVMVEARRMNGLTHGFVSMGRFVPEARTVIRLAADFMRRVAGR
jgi:acetyl esterase